MRFVHANTLGNRSSVNKVKPAGPARPSTNATKSVPVHTVSSVAQKTTGSKVYPKSLSVVDMLKLGKKIEQSSSMIDIFKFSISQMTWLKVESGVEFNISREPFASEIQGPQQREGGGGVVQVLNVIVMMIGTMLLQVVFDQHIKHLQRQRGLKIKHGWLRSTFRTH